VVTLDHCVSEHMVADFFTKPIQGLRFQHLRDIVLNIKPPTVHRSVLEDSISEDAQSKDSNVPEQLNKRII
jgi:hypothetical protein